MLTKEKSIPCQCGLGRTGTLRDTKLEIFKEYAKKNFDRLINLYINELIEHSKSKKNLKK